jgi:hypothetical protein
MTAAVETERGVWAARTVAQDVLADLPERWRHTVGVAHRAAELVGTVGNPEDAHALVAAAWLHDIGYAAALRDTGFHPLDGARYLYRTAWPARIAGLVAHHSEALCVATARGLAGELAAFDREHSAVADALTCADQTVGPNGRRMHLDQRLAEMLHRHGPGSPNAVVHERRAPLIRAAVDRVRLRAAREISPVA